MNLRTQKGKPLKIGIISPTIYSILLTVAFFLPLTVSFSVTGIIFAELFFINFSCLYWIFCEKEGTDELIVFLFSLLNISLIFITSFIIPNPAVSLISMFVGIPAFVAVISLKSPKLISNLEKVSKDALEYTGRILIIVSFLFLVISNHISFTAQTIKELAVCICFILISGIIGIIYFYDKADSGKEKINLKKSLLFSYSFFLLLFVFIAISFLLVINLSVSFV